MADQPEPLLPELPVAAGPAAGAPGEVSVLRPVEIGWKEWVSLPGLGVSRIVAKVDTGAKTSALHAFYVEPFKWDGEPWVRFGLHPLRKSSRRVMHCSAPVKDHRRVRDSGGHEEYRYVIETTIVVGEQQFASEITLTRRDTMRFRFLLGRNALRNRYVVNTARSYCLGKPIAK